MKKTRFFHFYVLRTKTDTVEKRHASLRRLGMCLWLEYDEKVAFLRGKLAGAYWGAAPAPYRERVAGYLRVARRDRLQQRLIFYALVIMLAAQCLQVAKVAWSAVVPGRTMFWCIVISVCLMCKPGVNLWREMFDEPDVIVGTLEEVV